MTIGKLPQIPSYRSVDDLGTLRGQRVGTVVRPIPRYLDTDLTHRVKKSPLNRVISEAKSY